MNILLLAPQPFFQERGTPIAVDLLVKELSLAGHIIDCLTFPEGEDKVYKNFTLYRLPKHFWSKNIGPGFFFRKVLADIQMTLFAYKMLKAKKYDVIHAVEESAFIALLLKKIFNVPFIYDADSLLSEQLADKSPFMKPFLPVFEWLENWLFRNAIGVVAVCDFIANRAKDAGSNFVMVLRDCPPEQMEEESLCASSKQLKAKYNIRGKCVMYIGNLEKYQGIDLLIESFSLVLKHNIKPPPSLVIVGGKHEHIKKYKKMAKELNISENVFFEGPSPISELRLLFKEADVLVSPRIQGKNTPMKIYSYLYSGKPIVATNLPTHTQVIDDTMAFLVEPNVTAFSHGIVEALLNENKSKEKALKALAVAKEKYTNSAFRKTLHCFYKKIEQLVCVDKNLR